MKKMKKPISILLSILMMLSVFSGMTLTVGAAEKTIAEGVIYKLGDTIVLPGNDIYYVKADKYSSARKVYNNGTVSQFEGDEYSYSLMIDEWGIYARLDTFDYEQELNSGMSVLGITFTGSGTQSDPYLPKLAFGVFESTWAGEGEGTEASPWLIKDLNDLRTLSANVADGMMYTGKYLKLAADIDCGSENWAPIGKFGGTFDGDSHTITYHITGSEAEENGLFAEISNVGTVKNLNVSGSIVSSADFNGGVAGKNCGSIINCFSTVDITTSKNFSGGIAGGSWLEDAKISYCAASGTLTWTGATQTYAYIGGITGENRWGAIDHCAMLGDVLAQNTTESWAYAGILIGRDYGGTTDCYYLNTAETAGAVNSDCVTEKTADELKEIGQAAFDAGYTVYGLALGAVASNPNQEAADAVIALIDAIGTVEYTDACKAKIDAARAEYDDLTADQQALVTNIDTLTAAETAYANLKAAADAAADPVSYLVWDDAAQKLVEKTGDNACKTYTEVTADTATFEDGMWYVVNGEILNGNRITVTGTAHLILTDGSKLTTNNGINVANGSTLNIYGQGAGTGTVTAKGGSNKGAGIGGKQNESGGTVNIYGGTVTATGSGGGAGIGGGLASVNTGGTGGTITIYGGTVTANGSGMGGAGIGGGTSQSAGIVTIYGGTVTANGNNKSPGIGPGVKGDGGTLTVCGGSVTAVGATNANAINCTVMNTIPGTGWENVNGTGDGTPIEINTEGQEYGFKKIQFLGVASDPNQEAANDVIDLIDAIGTVENTAESKAKVEAAKAAYDALTPEQKALVTNVETLTAAEAAVADFNAVPDGTALTDQLPETPGIYYLTQDITISSTWSVPSGETILDLNGYGIRMTGTGTVIDVCRDSSCILTLNDSRPTNSGGENRPTGILGGYITGGTGVKQHEGRKVGANCGGGIFVYNAGLNINGGTITGNHANRGGGVFIDSGCTVNMTGGAITGNTCVNYGGGVFLSEDSTFNVSNSPVITENRFTSTGNVTNIHLQVVKSQAEITIASPGLTAGAKLGIYELTPNSRQVTKGYSTYHSGVDPVTYFSCDTAGWTYKVNSNGELLSVPAFTVTWLNDDGTLIDTTTVAGDTVPTHADATKAADAQYSYTFSGWSNGTTTYAPDALPAVRSNVTYKATFTKIAKYTVTVPSDCTVSQTLPAGSDYYLATVQAPLEKDGKYFTYWKDSDGKIVGTYRTYTFYVGSDMALEPVYFTEADYAAERAKAVYAARALNVISKGEGAYVILAEHSVSTTEGLTAHGVLVTTDASLANADSMNCDNQNDIMYNFTAQTTEKTRTGMIQINAQLTGDTVYVRPYIVNGDEYHYFDIQSYALTATGDAAEEVVMLDSTDLDLTAENADGDAAAEAPADDAGEAASIISTILEVVMNLIQRIVNYIKLALSIVK